MENMEKALSFLPAPLSKLLLTRFSQDKKETFVKLVVLSLAAILCESQSCHVTTHLLYQSIIIISSFFNKIVCRFTF